jgi:CheY-like chemotaxis protein
MTAREYNAPRNCPVKSVAVVSRDRQPELLDTVLDAGDYDIVFVESIDRAYSCIKRVTPDLVIVCLEMEDTETFQLLSMLKLDRETADIPLCTYVVPPNVGESDGIHVDTDRYETMRSIAAPMN